MASPVYPPKAALCLAAVLLLAAAVDPKQCTSDGRTGLQLAEECGHLEVLQLLQSLPHTLSTSSPAVKGSSSAGGWLFCGACSKLR